MKVHSKIIDSFLNGEKIDEYKEEWIYTSVGEGEFKGKNIFIETDRNNTEIIKEIYIEVKSCLENFKPYNIKVWTLLFPKWREIIENTEVYIIVGLPEPNDATVIKNPIGENVIILDLGCWAKYYGKINVTDVVENIITHECCHICIGSTYSMTNINAVNSDYLTRMDALLFDEGFAHLISFAKDISEFDWNTNTLQEVKKRSFEMLECAVVEKDKKNQEKYLYDAIYGNYQDKYGAMIGMLYLSDIYLNDNEDALLREFKDGYKGIVTRILTYYKTYYSSSR